MILLLPDGSQADTSFSFKEGGGVIKINIGEKFLCQFSAIFSVNFFSICL
jgi:preprotein translocase subunit SecG